MSLLEQPQAQALLADAVVGPAAVRGCQEHLSQFLRRYLPLFYRKEPRDLATLVINGRQRIELIGTTAKAGPSEAYRITLSNERAGAVKAVLVELGVSADRITTRGVGATWPGRVNDIAPDGSLIPTAAALNRSVIVRLSCPS